MNDRFPEGHYTFSRFAHRFEQGGALCFMNALRLRPVYIAPELAERLQRHFAARPTLFDGGALVAQDSRYAALLRELAEEKVIAASAGVDGALDRIRSEWPMPYVSVMYLILSEQCNLSCAYCFINDNLKRARRSGGGPMRTDTADKALDLFARLIRLDAEQFAQEKTIIFYGGEPLINQPTLMHALDRIEAYRQAGRLPANTRALLISNGTLLTAEALRRLKPHKVTIGVSLDGGSADLNKHRRFVDGTQAFEAALGAVRRLQQEEIPFGLSITLSEESLALADRLLDSLTELGVKGICFNPLHAVKGCALQPGYDQRVADFLLKAYRRLQPLGFKEDRINRKISSFARAELYFWDCAAAGGRQIVVAPDGAVGICHGLLGERQDFADSLEDAAFDPAQTPSFLRWRRYSPFWQEECRDCPALGLCGGGCPLRAFNQNGCWGGVDRQFCSHAKKTLEFLVWELARRSGGLTC